MKTHKPTNYIIIYSTDIDELSRQVEAKMLNGWRVQGGVSVVKIDEYDWYHCFYQAMIK